ncbi:MAG: amidohydrolase family protein [Vicinamibacterales bacterium]
MTTRPTRPAVLLLAALAAAHCSDSAPATGQAPAAAAVTAFEGARLIRGDGTAAVEDAVVLVRDGVITASGPRAEVAVPAGAARVDLRGRTVMPLLVNVHGHIGYMKGATTERGHYSRDNVLDHLRRFTYYGIGAFQELGTDRDDVEIRIRDEQRAGTVADPALAWFFTAGHGIVAPTPGAANGGPFFATDVIHEAATPEQARAAVQALAAKKVDIVKLWVDDRNGTKVKLAPPVYKAAIEEAHARGLRAVAHVYYLDDAKDLVRSGVDGLAHMVRADPGVDDELVGLLKAGNVFACSTMSIQKPLVDGPGWLDDPALAETVRPEVIAEWKAAVAKATPEAVARAKETYARLERSMKRLHDGGARVVLCGDTGLNSQVPGFTEHRELEAIARAGVPPLEAIRAATATGAEVLGLTDRGTLTAGKRADFLVLTANPLDDIANSRRIAAVYKAGAAIDRDGLRRAFLAPLTP